MYEVQQGISGGLDRVEEIGSMYESGRSGKQIAEHFGRSLSWAQTRIKAAGVRIRSNSEAVHLAKGSVGPKITKAVREIVDGLLLGDGSLEMVSIRSARFSMAQTGSNIQWFDQVSRLLEGQGFECYRTKKLPGKRVHIKGQFCERKQQQHLRTRSTASLVAERERWYQAEGKRIPPDLMLSGLSIALWTCGDGTASRSGYRFYFCTDGFPEGDVEYLRTRLNKEFGIVCGRTSRNRLLVSRNGSRKKLVNLVQPHLPETFLYKVEGLRTEDRRFVLTANDEKEILEARHKGLSYGKIASLMKLPKSTVAGACVRLGVAGRLG